MNLDCRVLNLAGIAIYWAKLAMGAQAAVPAADAVEGAAMAISHGPFLQAPSKRGITVSWATTRKAVPWVEYRADSSGSWLTNWPTHHGLVDADTTYHNVSLERLEPGTAYVYRVASREISSFKPYAVEYGATVVSPEYRFTTLSKSKEAFSFVVVNDRHEQEQALRSSWRKVDWHNVDLAFLNGDMVHAVRDEQQLFQAVIDPCAQSFAANTPLVYVRGNHETRGSFARRLPGYFPTRSERYYYTIRHGPVMFLVLDCGEDKPDSNAEYHGLVAFRPYMREQAEWLAREIQKPEFQEARFRVCLLHIPPASAADAKFIQPRWLWENIVPLLNKGKVDLLICGHTHHDAIQEAGVDGLGYPMIIGGTETLIRCDVAPDHIQVSRTTLTGTALSACPQVNARE